MIDLAFADHLHGLPLPNVIASTVPALCNDIRLLPFAQGWGLGLHLVLEDMPGMRRAGAGGWAGLGNCFFWVDRSAGVAAALFTQVLPFFDRAILEAAIGFEQAVYAGVASATA